MLQLERFAFWRYHVFWVCTHRHVAIQLNGRFTELFAAPSIYWFPIFFALSGIYWMSFTVIDYATVAPNSSCALGLLIIDHIRSRRGNWYSICNLDFIYYMALQL